MGKTYTVNQLARMASVSVRMLHHYDAIGLLSPAYTGDNRYRYYGEAELLRLQQILIYRELDLSLADIGSLIDAPDFDRLATLRRQRERLEEKAERYAAMIGTIDRTIARLQGDKDMQDEDLYAGVVSPEKQADYEAWLVERFGPAVQDDIVHSRKAMTDMSEDERAAMMDELRTIEQALAEAMRRGVSPHSSALDPVIERHRRWIGSAWAKPCAPAAYGGLADVYQHPDFRARYETIAPGFADFLIDAMKSWARRQFA